MHIKYDNILNKLVSERQVLLDKNHDAWDQYMAEAKKELGEENLECIELAEKRYEADHLVKDRQKRTDLMRLNVLEYIRINHSQMMVDTIIEGLTSTGDAPSVLYDDDGHFAVESEGIQGVMLEDERFGKFDGTWFTTKESWKPTIREALNYYLDQFFDGWDLEEAKKTI
jgi:hypothetical protein